MTSQRTRVSTCVLVALRLPSKPTGVVIGRVGVLHGFTTYSDGHVEAMVMPSNTQKRMGDKEGEWPSGWAVGWMDGGVAGRRGG